MIMASYSHVLSDIFKRSLNIYNVAIFLIFSGNSSPVLMQGGKEMICKCVPTHGTRKMCLFFCFLNVVLYIIVLLYIQIPI